VLVLLNFSRRSKKVMMPYSGKILLNTHLDQINQHINLKNFMLNKDEGYIIEL
jgi:hypothetical protein